MDERYSYTGKYQCNHPESDFTNNSTGPIEMKKDNFVEYTHRNEKERLEQMRKDSLTSINYASNKFESNSGFASSNYQTQRPSYTASYNTQRNHYNKTKKKTSVIPIIIIILLYFLPVIFEILEDLF